MIFATIAGWLLKLGLSSSAAKRFAPYVFAAALLGLLAIGLGIAIHVHDRHVIEADRKAAEAKAAQTALDAERTANAADAPRQAKIQANDTDTRKAITDATAKDPAAAHAAAGPAAQAAAESLRRRGRASRD